MEDKKEDPNGYKTGYGKRPLWQWVLIYLVVAVVLYGLVYYFFLGGKNLYNLPGISSTPGPTTTTKGPFGY